MRKIFQTNELSPLIIKDRSPLPAPPERHSFQENFFSRASNADPLSRGRLRLRGYFPRKILRLGNSHYSYFSLGCQGYTSQVGLIRGALGVELEKAGEGVLTGDVFGPAVGGEDGVVEFAVGVLQPGGGFVVEVGEGAILQVRRRRRLAD